MFGRRMKSCIIVVKFKYGVQGQGRQLNSFESGNIYYQAMTPQLGVNVNNAFVFDSIKNAKPVYNYLLNHLKENYRNIGRTFYNSPEATPIDYSVSIISPDLQTIYK